MVTFTQKFFKTKYRLIDFFIQSPEPAQKYGTMMLFYISSIKALLLRPLVGQLKSTLAKSNRICNIKNLERDQSAGDTTSHRFHLQNIPLKDRESERVTE